MQIKQGQGLASSSQATIEIRENATGIVRSVYDNSSPPEAWGENGHMLFLWSEGNYACDCNRRLMFGAANDSNPCSDDQYSIRVIVDDEEVYSEFEPDSAP